MASIFNKLYTLIQTNGPWTQQTAGHVAGHAIAGRAGAAVATAMANDKPNPDLVAAMQRVESLADRNGYNRRDQEAKADNEQHEAEKRHLRSEIERLNAELKQKAAANANPPQHERMTYMENLQPRHNRFITPHPHRRRNYYMLNSTTPLSSIMASERRSKNIVIIGTFPFLRSDIQPDRGLTIKVAVSSALPLRTFSRIMKNLIGERTVSHYLKRPR
jgi:hypothetical protein